MGWADADGFRRDRDGLLGTGPGLLYDDASGSDKMDDGAPLREARGPR